MVGRSFPLLCLDSQWLLLVLWIRIKILNKVSQAWAELVLSVFWATLGHSLHTTHKGVVTLTLLLLLYSVLFTFSSLSGPSHRGRVHEIVPCPKGCSPLPVPGWFWIFTAYLNSSWKPPPIVLSHATVFSFLALYLLVILCIYISSTSVSINKLSPPLVQTLGLECLSIQPTYVSSWHTHVPCFLKWRSPSSPALQWMSRSSPFSKLWEIINVH